MSIQDITVVITSFKSDSIIKKCLKSIDKQCKIILIENSNDINFKKEIETEFNNVECILTKENLGYGKANNIGLEKVKSKYALILNPDATLESSTLKNFINIAKLNPEFAIIGPKIQETKDQVKANDSENSSVIQVKDVKGFAMFLNLSEFENIGFFDESFFIYFEEIDLCKRLINSNKKIYLSPSIKIYHTGGQSHNKSINKEMELSRNWHWMWSTFNFHKKHKGYLTSFFIVFPKLISAIVKIIFYSIFFNRNKRQIYYYRYLGLINAIIGKNSWYRPKV
tara:strand:+ start:4605 stop:5450 length:846 start_codon:yes stop_codon:yes gene_type:complete